MKAYSIFLPLISAFLLTFASCTPSFFTSDGTTWGTDYHIVYRADHPLDDSIAACLRRVDYSFSLFNPMSELSEINAGVRQSVSPQFTHLLNVSKEVSTLSGGLYDPTVAPLTRLWGFGPDDTALPSDSAVDAARALVGVAQCYVDSTGTLHRKHPATQFDFSSVAKGYGIDLVAKMLRRNGCSDFMIEIGGEISAQGLNRQRRPWRIQVDSPAGGLGHERLRVVELGPQPVAMATSGNYRNFRPDGNGGVYGHTISPITGRPVQGRVLSATVIAPDCTLADAIATACMAVADPDSALAIADRAAVSALIVYSSADTLATVQNSTFPIQH